MNHREMHLLTPQISISQDNYNKRCLFRAFPAKKTALQKRKNRLNEH